MAHMVGAATLVEPFRLEMREYPKPDLEEGAMLVETILCGICGTDKHGYKGDAVQYAGTPREVRGPYPAIPGHENVSRIVEARPPAGGKLTDFYGTELKVGDRIVVSPDIMCGTCYWCRNSYGYTWCDNIRSYGHLDSSEPPHILGGWAELMYIYPGSHIYKVPEGVSDEIACLAEPMAVTYSLDIAKQLSSMPIGGIQSGATVVVFGVGPLGLCHLIKSRLIGAGEIVAVDLSEYRLNFARNYGANHTMKIDETTKEERRELVLSITGGRGADVVVECAGVPAAFVEGLEMLRQGGTFVEVGHFVDVGSVEINPHRHICSKNIRMVGQTNLAYTGMLPSMVLLHANREKYDFDAIITHRYPYTEALAGLEKSMETESMKVAIHS